MADVTKKTGNEDAESIIDLSPLVIYGAFIWTF